MGGMITGCKYNISNFIPTLTKTVKARWALLTWKEVSGSYGDLGTFLPLVLGLAAFGVGDFSRFIFWAGFYNFFYGLIWDSPMAVQPMKTISAVVLAGDIGNPGLTAAEVSGAGISVGFIVFFLGITRLIDVVNWMIPMPIVRGLQLGLGMSMVRSGLKMIIYLGFVDKIDCFLLSIFTLCFILGPTMFNMEKRIPVALLLTSLAFILSVVNISVTKVPFDSKPGFPPIWTGGSLQWRDIWQGFLKAGFAQLPMTTLNSIVALCDLNNNRLFKDEKDKQLTQISVANRVGVMNLTGVWFGGMPMHHGAGGLVAQYSFGARGGSSNMFLGFIKMLIAVIFGASSVQLVNNIPKSILGVMLMFAGLTLAKAGISSINTGVDDVKQHERNHLIVLATAAVTLVQKIGWGFIAGMIVAFFNGGFSHITDYLRQKCLRKKEQQKETIETKEIKVLENNFTA